jgi:mono/diheme cytochrome c family protein
MDESRIQTKDGVLTDQIYESPVDRQEHRFRRTVLWVIAAIVVIVVALLCWRFLSDRPVTYSDSLDHFKYGSIGGEPGGSIFRTVGGDLPPYQIFKVLPAICPDKIPGGYASFGLVFESGHDLPIGVSKRFRLGFDQVGLNCAVCHTGTYRETPQSPHQIVLGMPAHQLDLQAFFGFVTSCSLDPRFTAENVIGQIRKSGAHVGPIDSLLYSGGVIAAIRESTLALQSRVGKLLDPRAYPWGRGRVDTFNPYKSLQFNWNLDQLPPDELVGASDFPSLWNQAPRQTMHLHWDGNNDSLSERNLSAALGAGVTPVTVDHAAVDRVRDWIMDLKPPAYPFAIDQSLAARGAKLYETACASCHADDRFGKDGYVDARWQVGQVSPIEKIGTDPHRLNSYTAIFAENQYTLYPHSKYQFSHFRKTFGYANQPLDGIWARAPYLHNGSVPTLRDLLDPPSQRPKAFYRGYDVYDQAKVGFHTDVAEEPNRKYTRYDTSLPGNSNSGHEYGTRLSADDKRAIVEYMKKL